MTARRAFMDDEFEELAVALASGRHGARDAALGRLMRDTGFRVSEILSVRIGDVVAENGRMVKQLNVERRDMKGSKHSRRAELFAATQIAIARALDYLTQRGFLAADDFLFQSRTTKNQAISRGRAWQIIHDAARRVGMVGPIGTHSLRKLFAQKLYDFCLREQAKGRLLDPLGVTQVALAHQDRKTTERYLDLRNKGVAGLVRRALADEG